MANDAIGCGAQFDAFLSCVARTQFRCSGDNFPGCNLETAAYEACCSSEGRVCPTL